LCNCKINLRGKISENGVRISVCDNGISVDPKHHERVFEMFKKLNANESGSGMGLAICKKIIEKHHGEIWMEINEPMGTKLIFDLPNA